MAKTCEPLILLSFQKLLRTPAEALGETKQKKLAVAGCVEHGLCLIKVDSSLKLGIRELFNFFMFQVALLGADSKYFSDEFKCLSDYRLIKSALGLWAGHFLLGVTLFNINDRGLVVDNVRVSTGDLGTAFLVGNLTGFN